MTDLLIRTVGVRSESGGSRIAAVPTLHVRGAAYAVIAECLRIQADARPQRWLARAFGVSPLSDDARGWYRAALGQIEVVRALRTLGHNWTLLHPEPGTSDCDYLAIGSGGVVTVSIKNHSGQRVLVETDQLLVNGRRTNHVRDARFEAERISKLLSTEASELIVVNPLIAIVDPSSLAFGSRRPRDVTVAASPRVARVFARHTKALSDSAVRDLVAAAERHGTWHPSDRVIDDTLRHEARFTRLRHQVDAAARRNLAWLVCGALATLAVVLLVYFR